VRDRGGVQENLFRKAEMFERELRLPIPQLFEVVRDIRGVRPVIDLDHLILPIKAAVDFDLPAVIEVIDEAAAIRLGIDPRATQFIGVFEEPLQRAPFLAVQHVSDETAQRGLTLFIRAVDDLESRRQLDVVLREPAVSVDGESENPHDPSPSTSSP
jgi:hypothetical protein